MGNCACLSKGTSMNFIFIDFEKNSIIYNIDKVTEKIALDNHQLCRSSSFTALNQDRIFITGGKLHDKSLAKTCLEICISRKTIYTHSCLEEGSQKGYSFVFNNSLYYIFSKLENKQNNSFLKLSLETNNWEALNLDSSDSEERLTNIFDLEKPGLAQNEEFLYIVCGYIPLAKTYSNDIFQLNLNDYTIKNLKINMQHSLKSPFCVYNCSHLYILNKPAHGKVRITEISTIDKSQKTIEQEIIFNIKATNPVFKSNNQKLIISGNPPKLLDCKKMLIEDLILRKSEKIVSFKYSKLEENPARFSLIKPINLPFDSEILISNPVSIAPVVKLPNSNGPSDSKILLRPSLVATEKYQFKILSAEKVSNEPGLHENEEISQERFRDASVSGLKHPLVKRKEINESSFESEFSKSSLSGADNPFAIAQSIEIKNR